MKKLFAIILLVMAVTACNGSTITPSSDYSNVKREDKSPFVTVVSTYRYDIVYDRETKVMYIKSDITGEAHGSTFTLMVNADGSPKLYTE